MNREEISSNDVFDGRSIDRSIDRSSKQSERRQFCKLHFHRLHKCTANGVSQLSLRYIRLA